MLFALECHEFRRNVRIFSVRLVHGVH